MKINEVERLAGITKKNIRFYEEQGLLNPRRNAENGYREYGQAEVEILRRIKLMRKLGVPIGEIRWMLDGTHTVADGMRRHLVTLEREKRNLQQSAVLCEKLQAMDIPLCELDAEEVLAQMEAMERCGASFRNDQNKDVRMSYIAPVAVTLVMVAFFAAMIWLLGWAYAQAPEEGPPLWIIAVLMLIFAAMMAGVVLALIQRIREIGKGEMDDARKY